MRVYNRRSEHSRLEQFEIDKTFPVPFFEQLKAEAIEGFRQTSTQAIKDIAELSPPTKPRLVPDTVVSLATETDAPRPQTLTEEELADSEHFRPGMDWEAGLTRDQWSLLAERFDQKKETDFARSRGDSMAATIAGQLVGGIPDPVNFIPFLGSYRAAKTTVRIGKAAGEAGIGAVATEPLLFLQADVTREEHDLRMAATNVAVALGIGGLFGTVGAGLSRISAKQRAWAVHKAAQDMVDEKKTDVGPILGVDEAAPGERTTTQITDPVTGETTGTVGDAPLSGARVTDRLEPAPIPEAEPIPAREAGNTEAIDPEQLSLLDKELAEIEADNRPGGRLDDVDKEMIAQGDATAKAKLDEADAIEAAAACLTRV